MSSHTKFYSYPPSGLGDESDGLRVIRSVDVSVECLKADD